MVPTSKKITATAVASVAVAAVAIVLSAGSSSSWLPARIRALMGRSSPHQQPHCAELIDVASVLSEVSKDRMYASDQRGGENEAVDACQLFSESYRQARTRFRDAARKVPGARLVSLPVPGINPSGTDNIIQDDDAMTYTMDLVVLPGTEVTTAGGATPQSPRHLVVHTSGVHGVEGYAGSAVQIAFLQLVKDHPRWGGGLGGGDKSRPTVVLVHAFNPHGMAHFRRVNENNVDLNRNGIRDFASLVPSKSSADDASDRRDAYEKFRNVFVPPVSPSTSFLWLWLRQWLVFAWQATRYGIPMLKEVMVKGQYHDPMGIFYGGDRLQSSYTVLERWIVDELLPSVIAGSTTGKSATDEQHTNHPTLSITWIDVHTGLGPSGEDTILPCLPKTQSRDASTILARLRERFPDSHHPSASAVGSQVASGYSKVLGQVGDYFDETFRPVASQSTFVVQEFGTIVAPLVGHALIVENAWRQRHQQQNADDRRCDATEWLRHAFYPDDVPWRENVVKRGLRVLLQGMLS